MDANGTRFHLLLGEGDWGRCVDGGEPARALSAHFADAAETCTTAGARAGFGWDRRRHQLTLRPCVPEFAAGGADRAPDPGGGDRRGAARDRYGNFYWIDESRGGIRMLPVATGVPAQFWAPVSVARERRVGEFHHESDAPPAPPGTLAGLAVTSDHYLVAGTVEPPGLMVFDLHAGGEPQRFCWTPPFAPFDLAARAGGGVWILDRLNRRYWGLDRNFRALLLDDTLQAAVPPDDFQPAGGGEVRRGCGRRLPRGVSLESTAAAGLDPMAIEALPDGSVLILTGGRSAASRLFHDGAGGRFGVPQSVSPFVDQAYDMAITQDGSDGRVRLHVATAAGNQAYAFDVSADRSGIRLARALEYLPMRLFGGKALLSDGQRVFYDFFEAWIPLQAQRRPQYAESATLLTPVFDGREPACVWHRLMLDACIPADAAVRVRSRAADERMQLDGSPWRDEPDPYLRREGSELPYGPARAGERDGTWELLFQRAQGRWLQLQITLTGDGRATPRLRALRAYYPRFSYLQHYVPALYRDDAVSASFLERFLANLEGFYTATEDRVAAVHVLFGVRSAPKDALDWLASWFGVALDPAWTEAKRRLFLAHAVDFFRQRGTMAGLRAALRLALDEHVDSSIFVDRRCGRRAPDRIRIVERYRTRRLPPAVAGDPTLEGPRAVAEEERWRPAQGRTRLIELYAESVRRAGLTTADSSTFPLRPPREAAAHWRRFSMEVLGFVPSASAADAAAWREFLARRHHTERGLAAAYRAVPSDVPALGRLRPPTRLPADGAPLADWYDFESIVLAIRRAAHHFSVLLPAARGTDETEARRRERLALVTRIVDLEKPAHTVFDVKFYWAMFRVGEARLGEDTVADLGGRAPELMTPLRLGEGALSEAHLAPGHPHDVPDRTVVGRDRIGSAPPEEMEG